MNSKTTTPGTLHLLCGLPGAGKSTFAQFSGPCSGRVLVRVLVHTRFNASCSGMLRVLVHTRFNAPNPAHDSLY
jgi:hypothetical protein